MLRICFVCYIELVYLNTLASMMGGKIELQKTNSLMFRRTHAVCKRIFFSKTFKGGGCYISKEQNAEDEKKTVKCRSSANSH